MRALHRTRALADSRFLDRLIRGRLWIPIVAAGLMGIVFMQVSMLKLNAGIGRAVQSAATLERQNANMRAAVSGMESGTRIDAAARRLGMVVPVDGSTHYVTAATRGLAATAASRMIAADPEAIARSKAATALAAGQTAGTALATAATGAAATPGGDHDTGGRHRHGADRHDRHDRRGAHVGGGRCACAGGDHGARAGRDDGPAVGHPSSSPAPPRRRRRRPRRSPDPDPGRRRPPSHPPPAARWRPRRGSS